MHTNGAVLATLGKISLPQRETSSMNEHHHDPRVHATWRKTRGKQAGEGQVMCITFNRTLHENLAAHTAVLNPNSCVMDLPSTTHLRFVITHLLSTTGPATARQQELMLLACSPARFKNSLRASSKLGYSSVPNVCMEQCLCVKPRHGCTAYDVSHDKHGIRTLSGPKDEDSRPDDDCTPVKTCHL
jgi:hypothetical protein